MPQYLYQVAYTSESLAAQIKNPQDRLDVVVGKQIAAAVGAKILGGGYSYGKYDITALIEAPDDVTMAAVLPSPSRRAGPSRQPRPRRC